MPELQAESFHLGREAEFLGGRPQSGDLVGGDTGLDHGDRRVDEFAGLLVRVTVGVGCAPNGAGSVVAGSVAVEGVDDVEVRLIAGSDEAVGEDVGVR